MKSTLLVLAALIQISCTPQSKEEPKDTGLVQENSQYDIGSPLPRWDKGFGIKDVINLVNEKKISRVEDLLPYLPESLWQNYTLMRESKSLQGATPENPRAILFGETGEFVLTFNGDSNLKGYNSVEMMEMHYAKKDIEFRRIDFENGVARVSTKNPQACTACHGKIQRPIWGEYPSWFGAYGEKDDLVEKDPGGKENYVNFLRLAKDHPRYKYLKNNEKNPLFPYQICPGELDEEGEATGPECWLHKYRPNNRLGHMLQQHSATLFSRIVRKSFGYKKYPYTLLYALSECSPFKDAEFVNTLRTIFATAYPEGSYPELWQNLKVVKNRYPGDSYPEIEFMVEKLFTDEQVLQMPSPHLMTWNLDTKMLPIGRPYSAGQSWIGQQVGSEIFIQLAQEGDRFVLPYTKAENFTYWYMRENPERLKYLQDISVSYDKGIQFYNKRKVAGICESLKAKAHAEHH